MPAKINKAEFIKFAQKSQKSYRPSVTILSAISKVDLIMFVGPSGVGKTTLMNKLGLPIVISDVTRALRGGEIDGLDYRFRSDLENLQNEIQRREFLQFFVSDYDEFYGTNAKSFPSSGPAAMAVVADLVEHFSGLGFNSVKAIYVVPPSHQEWMHRIGEDRVEQMSGRLKEAQRSLKFAAQNSSKFELVLNDSVENALADISKIIAGEPINPERQQAAQQALKNLI